MTAADGGTDPTQEAIRVERRRIRRRRKARLKAAALGRSRGGLTAKTHRRICPPTAAAARCPSW
ncbi:hypothetical protein GCM10010219_67990 [Streptomyces netropsis]|nr:hypothetical protein GCM10010219_67990 [Streptomyces netropsis]